MKTVYLAGPIAGTTEQEAKSWRYKAIQELRMWDIRGISPLRNEPAKDGKYEAAEGFAASHTKDQSRAIAAKNWFDVKNCDMILVNAPHVPDRPSYGTVWEIGAGYALGKDIVLVTDNPALLGHPDIDLSAGWKFDNLEDALDLITQILGPYTDEF